MKLILTILGLVLLMSSVVGASMVSTDSLNASLSDKGFKGSATLTEDGLGYIILVTPNEDATPLEAFNYVSAIGLKALYANADPNGYCAVGVFIGPTTFVHYTYDQKNAATLIKYLLDENWDMAASIIEDTYYNKAITEQL